VTARRLHLDRFMGRAYCGAADPELTDDPERATCLACLRCWRRALEREANSASGTSPDP
jgi:hypothetical protein